MHVKQGSIVASSYENNSTYLYLFSFINPNLHILRANLKASVVYNGKTAQRKQIKFQTKTEFVHAYIN